MDEYDDHLTPEMIFDVREGRLRRDELLCFAVEHLRDTCPECRQALQKVASELGLLSPTWLRQVAWKSVENRLGEQLPSIENQERQTERELATIRRLSTWPERLGRVKRARTWFRNPSTVSAFIEESKRWLIKDVDEAIEWAHLAWEVAYRVGEVGHPAFPIVWARAIAHEANGERVAHRFDRAEQLFDACQRFAHQKLQGEPYALAEVDALHASLLRDRGQYQESIRLLVQSVATYGNLEEFELAGQELATLANTYMEAGQIPQAILRGRQSLQLLQNSESVYLRVCAAHTLCMALTDDDRYGESERLYRRHRLLYGQLTDRRVEAAHSWLQGRLAMGRKRWDEAAEHFGAAYEGFEGLKRPYEFTRIGLEQALAFYSAGEFAQAEALAGDLVVAFRRLEAMNRHAAAALTLVVEAAKARRLTAAFVRSVSRFLAQSKRRPSDLVFKNRGGE